jgi:hypothetical protein
MTEWRLTVTSTLRRHYMIEAETLDQAENKAYETFMDEEATWTDEEINNDPYFDASVKVEQTFDA